MRGFPDSSLCPSHLILNLKKIIQFFESRQNITENSEKRFRNEKETA